MGTNVSITEHSKVDSKPRHCLSNRLQINHLGTALLAILMLPYLSAAPSNPPFPRLTIVSSETHYWTQLVPEELEAPSIMKKLNDKSYCTARYKTSL